jgi:hypothetical protein
VIGKGGEKRQNADFAKRKAKLAGETGMSQPKLNTADAHASSQPGWRVLLEIALVFGVIFLHGAWPTPDVNETGYITKAQHFWNHNAFAQDFFCNSGDVQVVYYWTFGWLTTLGWSLDTVAWVGRIVTWLMLAIAWRGLSYALLPKPWLAVLSAEMFVLLTEQAHMAGEWIVGGVEAKGFAWVFVLWALHALVRERWNIAWLLLGVATSLHVIVGGWAAVCLGVVWIASKSARPSIFAMLPGLIGGLLLALPGLWFALRLNQGTDWQTIAEANRIQVFERLPHHLYPLAFQVGYVPRHLLLWALFFVLCSVTAATQRDWRLRRFVFAAMGLAAIGFVLAWIASIGPTIAESEAGTTNFAASLLRFYWSRMSDILVPLGVTLVGLQFFCSLRDAGRNVAGWLLAGLLLLSGYDLWNQGRHLPWLPEAWGRVTSRSDRLMEYDDWRDVCKWVNNNTPPTAVFITPMNSNTFKWYTGRGEVTTWKDMPQDARGVVEWWKRINALFGTGSQNPDLRWRTSLAELGQQHLHDLVEKYGAHYAIVELVPGAPRLEQKPVYENPSYAIYQFDIQNK